LRSARTETNLSELITTPPPYRKASFPVTVVAPTFILIEVADAR
jgi:hypothetical protein